MAFTLLRLLLALSVAFAHYRVLTGSAPGWAQGISPTVAVQAFFVVSGWIVTASCEASPTVAGFLVRRMARLYPLYAAVVLAQAAVVLALVDWPVDAGAELMRYLAANLGFANFLQPSLFGFLDGARIDAINPSLWTMKIEVLYYLTVPLWVVLVRRLGIGTLGVVFAASTLYAWALEPTSAELARQLPGQLRFFVAGTIGRWLFTHGLRLAAWNQVVLAIVGVAGLVLAHGAATGLLTLALQPLWVAAFVAAAAQLLPVAKGLPDLSFGVYLLHAPLIQFTHATGWLAPGAAGLAAVLAATLLLAFAASRLIEQPAIRAGRRLSARIDAHRQPARPTPPGAVPDAP